MGLPFLVVYGAWVWKLAIVVVILALFGIGYLRRRAKARAAHAATLESLRPNLTSPKRGPVIPNDLLRTQEGVRSEPGAEPRLATGWQHVVRTGQVIAEAHRRIRAEENRAGVVDSIEYRSGIRGLDLKVLRTVRVAERRRRCFVSDEHDCRLRPTERRAHTLAYLTPDRTIVLRDGHVVDQALVGAGATVIAHRS